jgi:predicted ATP-grasp superfamily ATP-dependent carboligase
VNLSEFNRNQPLLLVGNTIRYLAESARRAGIGVSGIDAYADLDTQAACRNYRRAQGLGARDLAQTVLKTDMDEGMRWTYTAGFETGPEHLAGLSNQPSELLGNEPGVLGFLSQPLRFFRLLSELDIAHPMVLANRPKMADGWLHKAAGRFGGLGVQLASRANSDQPRQKYLSAGGYYERFIDGPLCSLLFAADGREVEPIGFNRIMARCTAMGDFRFAGALSGFTPLSKSREIMLQVARRLTRELGLRGINGLDFVLHRDLPLLLELNARPPATLELYESELSQGGLVTHLQACLGRLPALTSGSPTQIRRGMQIVYTDRDLTLADIDWPDWVSDRPVTGEHLIKDTPICTVHASGPDRESLMGQLRERQGVIGHLIRDSSRDAA